jgi:hypothetical protein
MPILLEATMCWRQYEYLKLTGVEYLPSIVSNGIQKPVQAATSSFRKPFLGRTSDIIKTLNQ